MHLLSGSETSIPLGGGSFKDRTAMRRCRHRRIGGTMKPVAVVLWLLCAAEASWADSLPSGTWIKRGAAAGGSNILVMEPAGSGVKMTMKITYPGQPTITMICTTQGDGKEAIVYMDGKPSGETFAIRRIDDRHSAAVIKNGSVVVNQKSEVSVDGKTITTESSPVSPPGPKTVEIWDKK